MEDDDLKMEDLIKEKDYGLGWTETAQNSIEDLLRTSKKRARLHQLSVVYFKRKHKVTTLPLIMLSALATTLAGFNTAESKQWISLIITIVSFIIGAWQGALNFLIYEQKAGDHNQSALSYANLARSINAELLLPMGEKNSIKFDFEVFSREFASIENNERPVPGAVYKQYKDEMEALA
jgi:hypothetical protein